MSLEIFKTLGRWALIHRLFILTEGPDAALDKLVQGMIDGLRRIEFPVLHAVLEDAGAAIGDKSGADILGQGIALKYFCIAFIG